MFDLSAIVDRATDLFKGTDFQEFLGPDLADRLSEFGIDSSVLEGTSLEDIQSTLTDAGIDLESLSENQFGEIAKAISEQGGIEGLDLSALLDRSK